MTRGEGQKAVLDRVTAALFGADVVGLEFLYTCGLEGTVEQSDKLTLEVRAAVARALEAQP